MKVCIDLPSAKPRLVEARDLARFHVEVSPASPSAAMWAELAQVLRRRGVGTVRDGTVEVSVDWLIAAGPQDAGWRADLRGMLDCAARHGWMPAGGRAVDAHVIWVADVDPLSEQHYRHVLGHFGTGLTVVTGIIDEHPAGFTCQSFSGVSISPPLVLICPGKSSTTWPDIERSGRFGLTILAEDQMDVALRFATRSVDRFDGVAWKRSPLAGLPVLDGAVGWIECEIEARYDGGDHNVVVGRVLRMDVADPDRRPLILFRGQPFRPGMTMRP
jgi:flavin reductase (DIM6/NTAB) family NADH-FMN oxidoreductase RutF